MARRTATATRMVATVSMMLMAAPAAVSLEVRSKDVLATAYVAHPVHAVKQVVKASTTLKAVWASVQPVTLRGVHAQVFAMESWVPATRTVARVSTLPVDSQVSVRLEALRDVCAIVSAEPRAGLALLIPAKGTIKESVLLGR